GKEARPSLGRHDGALRARRGGGEVMSTAECLGEETPLPELPLIQSWGRRDNPLPRRVIRAPARAVPPLTGTEPPPWIESGPAGAPFDFCDQVRRLCADVVARCEIFWHIDVSRLLFGVTQARSSRAHGLQARVTPLRFRNGMLVRRRANVAYQVQRY